MRHQGLRFHSSALQHTVAHCNTPYHTATHCKTLPHTATHCNACHVQHEDSDFIIGTSVLVPISPSESHTATHTATPKTGSLWCAVCRRYTGYMTCVALCCSVLQCVQRTLQHKRLAVLNVRRAGVIKGTRQFFWCVTECCSELQCVAMCCNVLQ